MSIKWEITRREQQVKTGNVPRASGAMKSRSSTSVRDVDLRLRRQKLLHAFRVSIQGTHVYWHHSAVATSLFNNENGKAFCKMERYVAKKKRYSLNKITIHHFHQSSIVFICATCNRRLGRIRSERAVENGRAS